MPEDVAAKIRAAGGIPDDQAVGDLEGAARLDFVNEAEAPGARVAVELSEEAAGRLVETITAVLAQAQASGHIEHQPGAS